MGFFGSSRKSRFKTFIEYVEEISGREIKSIRREAEVFSEKLDKVEKRKDDEFEDVWENGKRTIDYIRKHLGLNYRQIEDVEKAMKRDRYIR